MKQDGHEFKVMGVGWGRRTAITYAPAFPNPPFNQIPLGPWVAASTTLKVIKLSNEESHAAESLLHDHFNSPWYPHGPSCPSSSSHNEFGQYQAGTL